MPSTRTTPQTRNCHATSPMGANMYSNPGEDVTDVEEFYFYEYGL